MEKLLENIVQLAEEIWDSLPGWLVLVCFCLGISLCIGLPIWWLIATFGWLDALLFPVAIFLAMILRQSGNLFSAVLIAFIYKVVQVPLAAFTGIWWTTPDHDRFFSYTDKQNVLMLVAILFFVLVLLSLPRRAIGDIAAALARHTESTTNTTNNTEREIHH